jgi:hypothetical protein
MIPSSLILPRKGMADHTIVTLTLSRNLSSFIPVRARELFYGKAKERSRYEANKHSRYSSGGTVVRRER